MSKVITEGRVVCVDPNLSETGNTRFYPYQMDELFLYVDLTVHVPNRDGSKDIFSDPILHVSFMGGTTFGKDPNTKKERRYLTTNYTDISYQNPLNNTHECLGIESATISYTSWMVPTITVKFVDVRGASLFAPEEYTTNSVDASSFFRALFSFPSPLFRLTVKGYLGRSNVYNLKISKFEGQLNPETGNFEATVDFIGYMYGIYADMPLTYLALAPYTTEGAGYWSSSNFKYDEGTPMKTLSEFSAAVESAEKNTGTTFNSLVMKRQMWNVRKIEGFKEILQKWEETIPQIFSAINNTKSFKGFIGLGTNISWDFYDVDENTGIVYFALPCKIEEFFKEDGDYKDSAVKYYKEFCTHVESFNTNFGENLSGYNNRGQLHKWTVSYQNYYGEQLTEVECLTLQQIKEKRWISRDNDSGFNKILDNLSKIDGNLNCYLYFYTHLTGTFKEQVSDRLKSLDKINKMLTEEATKEASKMFQDSLGFKHTISNIYRMFFAHMDTFVHLMNVCVNNIKSNPRRLESLNWSILNTDLHPKFTGPIPPFTLFLEDNNTSTTTSEASENGNKTYKWPGDITGGKELEEVKLVESLIKAIEFCRHAQKSGVNSIPQSEIIEANNIACYPTTPYDWLYLNNNPYSYIINRLENLESSIFATFGLRYLVCKFYDGRNFGGFSKENKRIEKQLNGFGKIEAYNFHKANPSIPKEKINAFCNIPSENIINYLTDTGENNELSHVGTTGLFKTNNPVLFKKENGEYEYVWGKTLKTPSGDTEYCKYWLPVGPSDPLDIPGEYNTTSYCSLTELDEKTNYSETITQIDSIKNCIWFKNEDDEKTKINNIISSVSSVCGIKGKEYVNLSLGDNLVIQSNGFLTLSTNFKALTDYDNIIELLKVDKKAIKSFCGVPVNKDEQADLRSVFGMEAYYLQQTNEIPSGCTCLNIKLSELNILRKAYCFIVTSMPVYNLKDHQTIGFDQKFYGTYLAIGAYAWREQFIKECNIDPIVGKGTAITAHDISIPLMKDWYRETYAPETDILVDEFKKWALNDFIKIKDAYELKQVKNGKVEPIGPGEFESALNSLKPTNKEGKIIINQSGDQPGYVSGKEYTLYKGCTLDGKTKDGLIDVNIRELDRNYFENENKEVRKIIEKLFTSPLAISPVGGYSRKTIDESEFITQFNEFKEQLKILYGINNSTLATTSDEEIENKDMKLSMYLLLKDLYERWFAGEPNTKKWSLSDKHSQFNKFKYVDGFLRDIGNLALCDAKDVARIINNEIPGPNINNVNQENLSTSMYIALSKIAEKIEMMLFPLPRIDSWVKSNDKESVLKNWTSILSDIFTPVTTPDSIGDDDTSTYLCVWPGQPSSKLDIPNNNTNSNNFNNFANDGFDFFVPGTSLVNKETPPSLMSVGGSNFMVPFFIVDYGNQNQGIFKHISVSMSNPQATEASIRTTNALISTSNSRGGNENSFAGQGLYRIYNSYSYTCTVEALGNVQIVPMMHFQLVHIPMFHGVYQIIKVEHSIQAGEMTTKFVGIRLNKNQVPYAHGLNSTTTSFGSGDYTPGDNSGWSSSDGNEITPIYYFFNDKKQYNSLAEASGVKYDNLGNNCDNRDGGDAWITWRKDMISNPPEVENYFCFGNSVRNRMAFYILYFQNACRTNTRHVCARAVRQYVECCVHKEVAGWNGFNGKDSLEKVGYMPLTDESGTFRYNDVILDLAIQEDRTEFTNKWAMNGDVCLERTKSGREHACMFVSGYPYPGGGKGWISDYRQNNMWPYQDAVENIMIYRHIGRKLTPGSKFEEELEASLETIGTGPTISERPCTITRLLIEYLNEIINNDDNKKLRIKCIVAAILGSLHQESRMDRKITNSVGAAGIAQWLGDRRDKNFTKFINENGCNVVTISGNQEKVVRYEPGSVPGNIKIINTDLETQTRYLISELRSDYYNKRVIVPMLNESNITPTAMAKIYVLRFEVPFLESDPNYASRIEPYFKRTRYYFNHGSGNPGDKKDNWWQYLN